MRFLIFLIFNTITFYLLNLYLPGFNLIIGKTLLFPLLIFTGINLYVKPIFKWLFTTFIIFTLGLFSFIINVSILYLIDIYSNNITIEGTMALLIATGAITLSNVLAGSINWLAK